MKTKLSNTISSASTLVMIILQALPISYRFISKINTGEELINLKSYFDLTTLGFTMLPFLCAISACVVLVFSILSIFLKQSWIKVAAIISSIVCAILNICTLIFTFKSVTYFGIIFTLLALVAIFFNYKSCETKAVVK